MLNVSSQPLGTLPIESKRTAWGLIALLLSACLLLMSSVSATAQDLVPLQIGTGLLDHNRANGKRWQRVNFEPTVSGTHTVRVAWNSNANIQFSVFEVLAAPGPATQVKIGTGAGVAGSAVEWTGELDASREYYLGIWSASGAARFVASLSTGPVSPPADTVRVSDVLDYGVADASEILGSKFSQIGFMPKVSGEVTIELDWDGTSTMGLSVFETSTNTRLARQVASGGASFRQITLNLQANTQYHASTWVNSGTANWVMRRVQDIPDPDANISRAPDNASKPNIVLINTDDQRDDTLDRLPAIQRYLSEKGVTYTNAIVPTPSCCPSRATLLSGQYVHNNNQFQQQRENRQIFEKTINKYLQQEGYFTGTSGKYLHWIGEEETNPPPYWDRWTHVKSGFYNASMNLEGTLAEPGGYTTDIIFEKTKEYLREFEIRNDDKPWFVYINPMAPHRPYIAEYDMRDAPVARYVTNPAYQEADVSDKPPGFIPFRIFDDATSRDVFKQRMRTLYSVDREVEQLVKYLEDSGEIDNTLIIFTSDNGYLLGEHQTKGKFTPWRKSVQVPLVMRWPGQLEENVENDTYVSHVDISRTILEVAGVDTSRLALDGHNIFDETRTQFFMEYFLDPVSNGGRIGTWASIRTPRYQYTEWYALNDESRVSFREYYDMVEDPYQLENLLGNSNPDDDPVTTQLSANLAEQRSCRDNSCRAERDVDLPASLVASSTGTLDSNTVQAPRWTRFDFDTGAAAEHTIAVSWDSNADVRFNVFRANGTRVSTPVLGSNPGTWIGDLAANERYYVAIWSRDGTANFSATVLADRRR